MSEHDLTWKDTNLYEIKKYMSALIMMGLDKKPSFDYSHYHIQVAKDMVNYEDIVEIKLKKNVEEKRKLKNRKSSTQCKGIL